MCVRMLPTQAGEALLSLYGGSAIESARHHDVILFVCVALPIR